MQGLSLAVERRALDSLRATNQQLMGELKSNLLNLLGLVEQNAGEKHGNYITYETCQLGTYRH